VANPAGSGVLVKYPDAVAADVVDSSRERSSAARTPQVVVNDAEIFAAHEGGKLSVALNEPLDSQRALSIAYTPGVAQVSRAIAGDRTLAAKYTWANRLVAVISDGSAVLGLGDIGPSASLPVMEGKSALFKTFGGLDSIPIVLDTNDPDEIVETIVRLRPSFGAVNLEDISAPRCFEIERRVIEALDCPVMHDDQHGTAIVVLGALLGAVKVLDRDMHALRLVISGAGAAGVACANILLAAGIRDITLLDSKGIVHTGRDDLNPFKAELAAKTNPKGRTGGIAEALDGADMFLGLSAGVVPEEIIATMAPGGIVFALSNPDPEIHPDAARKYASVVATGRSDFPNQINNVLAFPGVFRGALDAGARRITEAMKVAAAEAIFSVVGDDLAVDHIVPSALDPRVGPAVAAAVATASKV
jgi:malate dehydrogenase (oxaloacetate-decarboxylating)